MGTSCPATIYLNPTLRNCFVNLSDSLNKSWSSIWKDDTTVKAIHVDFKDSSLYLSWAGGSCKSTNNSAVIEVSKKFGELLGLSHGQEVIATALASVTSCTSVSFYSSNQSDYDVLEVNSSYIESNLIHQLRVLWDGAKIPIWIQRNNCVVVTIGDVCPASSCSQIEEFTEIHLIPWTEVASGFEKNDEKGLDIPLPAEFKNSQPQFTDDDEHSEDSSIKSSESSSLNSSLSGGILTGGDSSSLNNSASSEVQSTSELSRSQSYKSGFKDISETTRKSIESANIKGLPKGGVNDSNTSRNSATGKLINSGETKSSISGWARQLHQAGDRINRERSYPSVNFRFNPLTGGVVHQSKYFLPYTADILNLDSFPFSKITGATRDFKHSTQFSKMKTSQAETLEVPISDSYRVQRLVFLSDQIEQSRLDPFQQNLLKQPSTVFVYSPNLAGYANRLSNEQLRRDGKSVNAKYYVFTASIHKMYSIKEKLDTSPTKIGSSNASTPNEEYRDTDRVQLYEANRLQRLNSNLSNRQRNVLSNERGNVSSSTSTIIRLVLTSQKNFRHDKNFLLKDDLLLDHVAVNNLIRRQLKIGVKSSIQIKKVHHKSSILLGLVLNPFGEGAKKAKPFNKDDIIQAFVSWILEITNKYPLLLASRMLIEFNITADVKCEFLLSGIGKESPRSSSSRATMQYFEINERTLDTASITVHEEIQPSQLFLLSPYPAKDTKVIDEDLDTCRISSLGGIDEIYATCMDFLLHGLGFHPVSQQICCSNKPEHNALLIYGTGSTAGGSGKTSLAHALCNSLGKHPVLAHISIVECVSLRGKRIETIRKSWQNKFNNAAWHEPAVILFDDLDQLISAPSLLQENGPEAHYSLRLAQVFKTLVKNEISYNSKVVVIATSISRDSVHPVLRRSHGSHVFSKSVEIPLPDQKQRIEILQAILRKHDEDMSVDNIGNIATKSEGCSPKDLNTLVARACQSCISRRHTKEKEESAKLNLNDFDKVFQNFKPASLHGIKFHLGNDLSWQDVGGLHDIKQTLKETLEWPAKYPELYSSVSMRLPSGILLYGPPGCGKTMLAGVIAKECGLNFMSIKGPELLNKYIGASEQAVRDLFHRAQSAKPCILFFDEFDSMAPRRGHDSTGVTDRVVNQLLTQIDGVEGLQGVYILAATSRPDLIDPALLRPGRVDKSLYCGMPDQKARLEILKAHSSKLQLGLDVNLSEIAGMTENFSGADLKALLSNAQLERIHEMKLNISDKVVKSDTTPSNVVYFPSLNQRKHLLTTKDNSDWAKQAGVLQDNFFRHVFGKANHSPMRISSDEMKIKNADLQKALSKISPSVSQEERHKYAAIYQSFKSSKKPVTNNSSQVISQRATLA